MKNKPLRHKETNTFKFIPFHERIANLNIDVFHYVSCVPEDDEEETTYLHRCIEKWSMQNGTLGMEACLRELPPCTSLPQLLHHKEQAVNIILKHLNLMDPLTLQSILELLVAIARDLRQEFYPHFEKSLEYLFSLVSTSRDPEVLEWTFQCIAYLLKFLWKSLLREPASLVYHRALPLLQDSKPAYIREFAAQCFAFVARKVRDKSGFISAILSQLHKSDDGISGTGRLLFETLSGVSGTLHSSAPIFLEYLLSSLGNDSLPTDILREVLSETLAPLSSKLKPINWDTFWHTAGVILSEFQSTKKRDAACKLLSLVQQVIESRGGTLVSSTLVINKLLIPFLSNEIQDKEEDETTKAVIQVAASILCAPGLSLTQELTASISALAMDVKKTNILLPFVSRVISCPGFEIHILPKFLKFCRGAVTSSTSSQLSSAILKLLAKLIIIKSPPCHSGLELRNWKIYQLDLGTTEETILKLIMEQLNNRDNFEEFVSCLVIFPHVKNFEKVLENKLESVIMSFCVELSHSKTDLFALSLAVEAGVHCNISFENLLAPIMKVVINNNPELCVLRMLDLIVTSNDKKEDMYDKLMENNLHHNLSSPYHKVRVLTCHIFSILKPESLFTFLLDTENTPATMEQYRERVQKLGKLEPLHLATMTTESRAPELALRFLIGQLYVNFNLLWDPMCANIASHATSQPIVQFWPVLMSQLHLAMSRVLTGLDVNVTTVAQFSDESLAELCADLEGQLDSPDHVNFRCLLWNCLTLFPEICETRTRDLAPLFLSFLKEEFHKSEASYSYLWNVLKTSGSDNAMDIEEDGLEEANTQDVEELEEEIKPKSSKSTTRILISHLQLFSKLRNPKAMHRETELYYSYHDLLKHRISTVQKLALDCIMQYKHPSLIPYKEQLYGLIEDKGFKSQLVKFNLEVEGDNIVLLEHRPQVIPILMSILFSKMQGKGSTRRAVILRFLSACLEDELLVFLKLAFKGHFVESSTLETVNQIINNVDLEKVIPPKRLTSAVNLATIVLSHLGHKEGGMPKCTSFLIRVLLIIAARIAGVTKRKQEVAKFALLALRSSRKAVTDAIGRVFAKSNEGDSNTIYKWSVEELDAVFEVVVWPSLQQLPKESSACPTALLRLFLTWSQNPRFFPLLVKHPENNLDMTPLNSIVTLLCTEGTRPPVTSAVLDLCQRLLTLVQDDGDDAEELQVNHIFSTDPTAISRLKLSEPLNYGSEILLPHVTRILSYLHRRTAVVTSKKRKNVDLSPRVLSVLSRISEMVTDPEPSLALLQLIVPICLLKAQRGTGDGTLVPLLTTLENLFRCITPPENLVLRVTPLFSTAVGRQSRQILCSILFSLIDKSEAKIIADLNSWDPRRLEDPNYDKRISAFMSVTKMEDISLELGLLVIHNCYYTLKMEKDISLRDCSSHCLQTICPLLAHKFKSDPQKRTLVLERTVLELLHRGVKDKDETMQDETLALFGVMVRKCGELHPTLRDLQELANENDLEVDFFENIRHLQVHRRSRALLRFCQVAKERRMRPLTLTQFILPLSSIFLCNEKYAKTNSMIDAAIAAIEVVCSQLPWQQYEAVLKFQLSRLPRMYDYQRQLVRTVIAVLDAFHFDLSNASQLEKLKGKPKGKLSSLQIIDKYDAEINVIGDADGAIVKIERSISENEMIDDKSVPIDTGTNQVDVETETVGTIKTEVETDETITADDEPGVTEAQKEEEELETVLEAIPENKPVTEKPLAPELALKIKKCILYQLLPRLQGIISARTAKDNIHKVNRSQDFAEEKEQEAQEVLRVPIALAIVKLLQKLPHDALAQSLSGVLLKVCVFLRSRLESTRRVARDTLKQILQALGPRYLPAILNELTSLLTRGYQVHVLIYTVHSLIVTAAGILGPGDIDPCLQSVISVCKADLFGEASDEKEVAQIVSKVVEARSHKSYDTFHLLARFSSERCLTDLLIPLRDVIRTTHNYKVVKRVAACLQQLVQGLAENKFIASQSLLIFAYGAASESLPALSLARVDPGPKEKLTEAQKAIKRPDTFLIEPAPKRSGPVTNKSLSTHAYHFVAFGLHLLHFLLKRDRVADVPVAMLNPFVNVVVPCLQSQHTKLTTLSLQCLAWLLKFDLPLLREHIGEITDEVFKLLHKFAGSGQGKGDTFDLANAAFKVVGVLVRDVTYHQLNRDQMRLVLLYAERDIQATGDGARQATAFTLLRAVLRRRVRTEELRQVVHTVATLAITSETTHIRQNARQVYLYYLIEYHLGKKHLEQQLTFLLGQLSFELETGRASVFEILQSLVSSLSPQSLSSQAGLIYVAVAASLVNDDSPECRKAAAVLLRSILQKLDAKTREQLFGATLLWWKDAKAAHRRLAVQLCGLFLTVERDRFENHLSTILPLISKDLCPNAGPGRFVRAPKDEPKEEDGEISEEFKQGTIQDHLLFQTLQLVIKISTKIPKWFAKYEESRFISEQLQPLLHHPHEWVRLASSQLLGCVFASLDPVAVGKAMRNNMNDETLLLFSEDPAYIVKSLTLDLCEQLQLGVSVPFADQVVKNLIYLARVIRHGSTETISPTWLAKKIRKTVNEEVAKAPASIVLRSSSLKWSAGVVLDYGTELTEHETLLHHLLAPVAREIGETANASSALKKLAKEVATLYKKQIGVEQFARAMSKLQTKMIERRETRKRKLAQEVISDPEKSAQRKIRKQQIKKIAKKRKINEFKGRIRKNFRDTEEELDF